ncbi:MAG: SufE family protein [Alphaproteobacteria bacterium]|nr:SufE family protein [Alphaproteobacteria bacterium]
MNYIEIKKTLMAIDDPMLKLETVMDFGHTISDVPENATCTEIHGCASRVEICRLGNNFFGRADSHLVRGIVVIITAMVDGKTPDEIRQMDIGSEFASLNIAIGAGRVNGVNSMIRFLQNL